MEEGNTVVNTILGAIVGSVAGSVLGPFGPVAGGAVAGYLQGGERSDGLRVGAYAGVIMLAVSVLLVGTFLVVFGVLAGATAGGEALAAVGGLGIVVFFSVIAFGLVTTVGLAAVGGYLGNYVKYDTDIGG